MLFIFLKYKFVKNMLLKSIYYEVLIRMLFFGEGILV